ncbi:MAG: molybdenum cofactor guanylyltransferase [Bellilinea sp.]|nr:molybdenum cofactor guanylyltransferase [Bellilinea sp.]
MKLTVVVQAGGESRRMGRNKALLPFLGQPLIQRVIERVRPIADEILITANQPADFEFLKLPVFEDVLPGQGALGGLLTALTVSSASVTAVVACDMPFLSPNLLQHQAKILKKGDWDAVVPKSKGGYEPFHGVYQTQPCRQAVRQAIERGEKKLIAWFPAVRVRIVESEELNLFDPLGRIFWNVNTPEEFQAAEQAAYAEND